LRRSRRISRRCIDASADGSHREPGLDCGRKWT
jgi:hypothetical protein